MTRQDPIRSGRDFFRRYFPKAHAEQAEKRRREFEAKNRKWLRSFSR